MSSSIKLDLEENVIHCEIHHQHTSLMNIKDFVKESFAEYYFGRSNITIFPDLLATKEIDSKREKLVRWFVKSSDIDIQNPILARRIIDGYKKIIKIKITTATELQQNDVIPIRLTKFDHNTLLIQVKKDGINLIANYIKSRFLFCMLRFERMDGKLYINIKASGFENALQNVLEKKSIAGKRVVFIYDKSYIDTLLQEGRGYKQKENYHENIREYMLKIKNSYTVLRLENGIKDIETIKRQYHKLAREYHPDRFYCTDENTAKANQDMFMQVKEAYEALKEHLEKKSA